ncbi:MAG: hypothetical protein Q4B81_07100 [Moraxella sp.]|nr:hypothetical protein [Moraxella sp.]
MATTAAMKEKYFRRQALYWLILAGAMLLAWFILWIASSAPAIIKNDEKGQDESRVAEIPTHIETLGELNKEVPPIDFSTLVRDLRTYPAEFKDKHYFNDKKYAIQLMDVSQNEIITNYLDSRPEDRSQFAYFRYLDDNQNPRYVLTYGKFDSAELATAATRTVDFGLPSSIAPSVVSMADYLKIIDDYERGEAVRDLSSRQPRQVRLQATRNEIPVQAATRADEELAHKSIEQAEERATQIQQIDRDAQVIVGVPQSSDTAGRTKADEPRSEPVKSESKQDSEPKSESKPEPKSEPKQDSEPKPVATPNVNTPKVPGSE